MISYEKLAMRHIGPFIEPHLDFFSDLKNDLKRSGMKKTLEQYLSTSLFTCVILFIIELPLFAFIFSLLRLGFLFSLFMAFTASMAASAGFFLIFLNYPRFVINDKAKKIDRDLPFAGIYLSTIASSRLPPHRIFEIFSEFKEYGEIAAEVRRMVTEMKAFGLNIYDSLENAVKRTPSKEFKDLLWSISSTLTAGGDLWAYLEEQSKSFLNDYRRKLSEFAHSLSIYLEIYLTALVLGAIFFTILTSLMAGLGGAAGANIVLLQFLMIFIFIPLVSIAFIIMIKSASPGGE